jgi:hypothetical protein
VSKCNVGPSLMFIYIQILSHYKLFPYINLCLKCNVGPSLMFIYIHIRFYYMLFHSFNWCLSVMLDSLSYECMSVSFLTLCDRNQAVHVKVLHRRVQLLNYILHQAVHVKVLHRRVQLLNYILHQAVHVKVLHRRVQLLNYILLFSS